MILIDCVYVNEGGSLVLLKHLVSELEDYGDSFYYLFDDRVKGIFNNIDSNRCEFISSKVLERRSFYKRNINRINKVLCFGSVPPPIFLDTEVYVYFHNSYLLKPHVDISFIKKIFYFLKKLYLHFFKNNVNFWIVQNSSMKEGLASVYLGNIKSKILTIPFYPELHYPKNVQRISNSFIYVSTYYPHKNHEKLIKAFCNAYDQAGVGFLTLTVPQNVRPLIDLINKKRALGYPIANIGFVDRNMLGKLYKENEFLIFPSVTETFGLGLAEAIDGGCKIIASDLPYVYEICKPSYTFDPTNIDSIKNSIITSITGDIPEAKKIIHNDIRALISLLLS